MAKDNGQANSNRVLVDRGEPNPMLSNARREMDVPGNAHSNDGSGAGRLGGIPSQEPRPDLSAAGHYRDDLPTKKTGFIERIGRDASQPPPLDPVMEKRFPVLQECMRCTRDSKGRPRAGGEVKTVASGINYKTSLVMPEEGVQVQVVHGNLSEAWEALEGLLSQEPVPWIECSEFATRRAKQKGKKEEKNT